MSRISFIPDNFRKNWGLIITPGATLGEILDLALEWGLDIDELMEACSLCHFVVRDKKTLPLGLVLKKCSGLLEQFGNNPEAPTFGHYKLGFFDRTTSVVSLPC